MRTLYFLLTLNLGIWTLASAVHYNTRRHPGDEVTFRINTNDDETLIINLVKTDSFLANGNLPVWTVPEDNPKNLALDTTIMETIGQWSVYHNKDNSAAAIYFHNLHEFYGVVDVRFILKGIPIEHVHDTLKVRPIGIWGVRRRVSHRGHRRDRSADDVDSQLVVPSSLVTDCNKNLPDDKFFNDTLSSVRSRRDTPEVVYVQVLVMVDHDFLGAIRNEYYRKFGIVEYLLTLFNSVDMLFSKIEIPKIRINIAGIIIGTGPASFPSLTKCYRRRKFQGAYMYHMEVDCLNHMVRSYPEAYSETIPLDSYNVIIFLTNRDLRLQRSFVDLAVEGVNLDETDGPYKTRRRRSTKVPTISVHHAANFGSFHTIAHELAHALRDHSHDKKPYVDERGECSAYLMKEGSDTCEKCLSWSPKTKKILRSFFSSRDRCFFMNKPQSLYKPGPRKIWTEDEQCRCYGYESASGPGESVLDKLCRVFMKNECRKNLRCRDAEGKLHKTPIRLDGTPCCGNQNNVCWNRRCTPVEQDNRYGR